MLEAIRQAIEQNPFVKGLIYMQGLSAERMKHNDHSKKHVDIVTDRALTLYNLLRQAHIATDLEKEGFSEEEIKTAIFLAAYLHDVGIGVSREHHESFSACLAKDVVWELLRQHMEPERAARLTMEILHMIREHRSDGNPLTLEGEIVRLADALDMEKGRAAKEAGIDDMHKISALAIEEVRVGRGEERPIRVEVAMKDMSGMFHVIFSLKKKIGRRLARYVELVVEADGERIELMGEHGQD